MDLEAEENRKKELYKEIRNFCSTTNQFLTQLRDMESRTEDDWGINFDLIRNEGNMFGPTPKPQDDKVEKTNPETAKRRLEEDAVNTELNISPKRTRTGRRF